METPKLLIVDDNAVVRETIANLARELKFSVIEADSAEAALVPLTGGGVDVLLCDDDLGTGVPGMDFISSQPAAMPTTVVLMSGNPKPTELPEAIRYLAKPFTIRQLQIALSPHVSLTICGL